MKRNIVSQEGYWGYWVLEERAGSQALYERLFYKQSKLSALPLSVSCQYTNSLLFKANVTLHINLTPSKNVIYFSYFQGVLSSSK